MTIDNQIATDQASPQYSQKPPIHTYMGDIHETKSIHKIASTWIQKEASFDQNFETPSKLNTNTM